MSNPSFPFGVRLIRFSTEEATQFAANFSSGRRKGYGYAVLDEDNLKDPDIYIANGDDLKALVILSDLRPGVARPALVVGSSSVELPYSRIARPIDWTRLFEVLDDMVERRADALSRLGASELVSVPERRRSHRLDLDLTDPAEYARMRTRMPDDAGVLVVDKSPAIHSYLAERLMRHNMPVAWVNDECRAIELCRRDHMAVVMINTSAPGVDPYRLCKAVKENSCLAKVIVIFLVGKPFVYETEKARQAGADGFLTKPLSSNQLIAALKKFLPSLLRKS